ncbi:MAG: hypothetical protein COT91_02300 [Candidatus Doudnabacteria bacterium CG10_big_fil_rev_8_21_14_0_10_41_10]|uniref:Shikimate kinase n=1 Tax=Candidatus Doudnabacteria bacterium CG10_big_fil_rev_8_21_14_0_10_41_10 TaxID=1974551 RepID=A0A2H0VDV3_9BACT|nr:MAG: hypothetical protein COT91_02300 [Candidatus Doudnabacteria bacterium CG10_big_fil_rev_8_21_14_0_10_41_10]
MSKYYITGISGTGKSTLAEELKKRGFFTIDIDIEKDLCCWRNKKPGRKLIISLASAAVW